MACGKTRKGRKMASELGLPFIDLDSYIEVREGRTIAQIFAQSGEAAFRRIEADCLRGVCGELDAFVMAVGGGTPCFHDNMAYMNGCGHTLFIDAPVEVIVRRLMRNRANRPLVRNLKDDELLPFVRQQLADRRPFYERAAEVIVRD